MPTTNLTIYVKYTAPSGSGTRPNIGYFTDSNCKETWKPSAIDYGNAVNYTFKQGSGTSPYAFAAITFFAQDSEKDVISQVGRNFQQGMSGPANFEGMQYVSNVDMSSQQQISFSITNNNSKNEDKGYLSLQVTIEDSGLQCLYTSADPQVELKPKT